MMILDDEPDGADDPNHYIVINGFSDAAVFQLLIELGVTADAVIKVRFETNQADDKPDQEQDKVYFIRLSNKLLLVVIPIASKFYNLDRPETMSILLVLPPPPPPPAQRRTRYGTVSTISGISKQFVPVNKPNLKLLR